MRRLFLCIHTTRLLYSHETPSVSLHSHETVLNPKPHPRCRFRGLSLYTTLHKRRLGGGPQAGNLTASEKLTTAKWTRQQLGSTRAASTPLTPQRERILYCQPTGPNPLNHRDSFSRSALRHGSSNLLFQVALYLAAWFHHSTINPPQALIPEPSLFLDQHQPINHPQTIPILFDSRENSPGPVNRKS